MLLQIQRNKQNHCSCFWFWPADFPKVNVFPDVAPKPNADGVVPDGFPNTDCDCVVGSVVPGVLGVKDWPPKIDDEVADGAPNTGLVVDDELVPVGLNGNVGLGANSPPGAEPNADVALLLCEPVKEKVDFGASLAVVVGGRLLEPTEPGAATDAAPFVGAPNVSAGLVGALLDAVLLAEEESWLEADVVLLGLAVNENVGFDDASLPAAEASFVVDDERWPNMDIAPPDEGANENVGLEVVADDEVVALLSPEAGWPNAGVLPDGANEDFVVVPLLAATVDPEVSSFFPNGNGDIEPDEPNRLLPNEDAAFKGVALFPNRIVLFAGVVLLVEGEMVAVVGNVFVDVPVPKTGLGAAFDEPLTSAAVVDAPASVCFPKALVKDGVPNVEPPPKAGAFAPTAPENVEEGAGSLVSPAAEALLEVVGAPKVNFGLLSGMVGVAVENAGLADGCPNDNFEGAAGLVVVADGVVRKEKPDVDGFDPGGAVVDGAEPAVCQVEGVNINPDVAGGAVVAGVEDEGVVAAWDAMAGTLGLANEKAGALGASVVRVVVPDEGWV